MLDQHSTCLSHKTRIRRRVSIALQTFAFYESIQNVQAQLDVLDANLTLHSRLVQPQTLFTVA